jgi:hypothetical protein
MTVCGISKKGEATDIAKNKMINNCIINNKFLSNFCRNDAFLNLFFSCIINIREGIILSKLLGLIKYIKINGISANNA